MLLVINEATGERAKFPLAIRGEHEAVTGLARGRELDFSSQCRQVAGGARPQDLTHAREGIVHIRVGALGGSDRQLAPGLGQRLDILDQPKRGLFDLPVRTPRDLAHIHDDDLVAVIRHLTEELLQESQILNDLLRRC